MDMSFEKTFADFIDGQEYDDAESALFSIVRSAYRAGRDAAGGAPPKQQEVLHLVKKNKQNKRGE